MSHLHDSIVIFCCYVTSSFPVGPSDRVTFYSSPVPSALTRYTPVACDDCILGPLALMGDDCSACVQFSP